jgi:hypothetical protein
MVLYNGNKRIPRNGDPFFLHIRIYKLVVPACSIYNLHKIRNNSLALLAIEIFIILINSEFHKNIFR